MKVSISDLRALSERLLLHLEQNGRSSIEVAHDHYWDITRQQRYDPCAEPNDFDIGQLSDDWSQLQTILSGEGEAIGYALVWLSTILRAVGEETVG